MLPPYVLQELDDLLSRRQLVLFVGSDLPQQVTGLPSRADLARELAQRRQLDERLPLADIAQRLITTSSRNDLVVLLRRALETTGKSFPPFHDRVVALTRQGLGTIITTAYDNLLERAFERASIACNCVVTGDDLGLLDPGRPTLIKLYGDLGQPLSLVVTEQDHNELLSDPARAALLTEVRNLFVRSTVLFLGYDLSDPDFRFLFTGVTQGRLARQSYAVWPGLPEVDVQMWRDRKIMILDAAPFDLLEEGAPPPEKVVPAPAAPPAEPPSITVELPPRQLPQGQFDYDYGTKVLQRILAGADTKTKANVATLAAALQKNDEDAHMYGEDEASRKELSRIIDSLNRIALEHCEFSFNELCTGEHPVPLVIRPAVKPVQSPVVNGSESAVSARQVRPATTPSPAAAPTGPIDNRWALLVGVNRYVDPAVPALRFCVNDVIALDKMLRGCGYTVVALHDDAAEAHLLPTRDNVEAALANICSAVGPNDLLWIHFACHGKLLSDGRPVLLTADTRLALLEKRALVVAEVEQQMRDSGARRLVLTLDACHTGVEMGRDIADPDFIHQAYELAEGFALIAASTAQQIAQEWQGHGVFTYYLLEGLNRQADREGKSFVTVDDLKTHVLAGLRRWRVEHSGMIQEPTARTEGMGDIILADYRSPAPQ